MYKLSVYSSQGDFQFEIEETQIAENLYSQLWMIFSTIDYDHHATNCIFTQKMSDNIKNKINRLVIYYEKFNIQLRKLSAQFSRIPNDEFFFVLRETEFTVPQIISFFESIRLLNEGIPFEELDIHLKKPMNDFNTLFSEIVKDYEILTFMPKGKTVYGEKEKNKRVCKYCHKNSTETKFNEEAHAISESLGNKILISAEECDTCNHRFAETIEKDLFNYLNLHRVLYGKKGKKKVPELHYKNGISITYKDNKATIIDTKGTASINNHNAHIPLELFDKINLMNLYRCLTKFAIAVLPQETVNNLQPTIDWITTIKGDGSSLPLPSVACLLDHNNYFDQPELIIYKRKDDKVQNLPFLYCELKITFFIFVYIIPFADKDSVDFSLKENYDFFWKYNKHYNHFTNWTFNDFSLDLSKKFIINLEFNEHSNA